MVAAYGLAPEKVLFIPHGVDVPKSHMATMPRRRLMQDMARRGLAAGSGLKAGNDLSEGENRSIGPSCASAGLAALCQNTHAEIHELVRPLTPSGRQLWCVQHLALLLYYIHCFRRHSHD